MVFVLQLSFQKRNFHLSSVASGFMNFPWDTIEKVETYNILYLNV